MATVPTRQLYSCRFVQCGVYSSEISEKLDSQPDHRSSFSFYLGFFEGEQVPAKHYQPTGLIESLTVEIGEEEEKRLLDRTAWFSDELINTGVGMLWANLLTPCFAFQDYSFNCLKGRNILDACTVDGNVPVDQRGSGPTLCYSSLLWQASTQLHTLIGSDDRKRSGHPGNAQTSRHEAALVDPDVHITSPPPLSTHQKAVDASQALRKLMRKGVALAWSEMGVPSPAPSANFTCHNLYDLVRAHRADTLVFPANMDNNHWVFVAVTGLTCMVESMDLDISDPERPHSCTRDPIAGSSSPQVRCRAVVLDSLEGPSSRNARACQPQSLDDIDNIDSERKNAKLVTGVTQSRKRAGCHDTTIGVRKPTKVAKNAKTKMTKKNAAQTKDGIGGSTSGREVKWERLSLPLRVIEVVLTMLTNEWVWSSKSDKWSTGSEYVKVAKVIRARLMRYVFFSFPAVPQQQDLSQCGPMAILAMQAFCTNEEFRTYCLEGAAFRRDGTSASVPRPATGKDNPREAWPKAYSFEASFELRWKILYFVRKLKGQAARAE